MDAGEGIGVVIVSVLAGFLSVFLLKEVLSDSFLNLGIDILEYLGVQVYYQASPLTDAIFVANQDDTYNWSQKAYDLIRFFLGFSSVFGSYLCIKTFFVRWF